MNIIDKAISNFFCKQDADVENFLKTKAINYEKTSKSRTYFIVNENSLIQSQIVVLAYFTLSLKTFSYLRIFQIRRKRN